MCVGEQRDAIGAGWKRLKVKLLLKADRGEEQVGLCISQLSGYKTGSVMYSVME